MDETTGKPKPDSDEFKLAIKNYTRLNEAQKVSALASLEKCLNNEFPWTQPLNQYDGVEKYISEGLYKRGDSFMLKNFLIQPSW